MFAQPSLGLQAFLRDFISSYEELEALLVLARSRDRSWSAPELAEALKAHEDSVTAALAKLARMQHLLAVSQQAGVTRFQYQLEDEGLQSIVAELDSAYDEQRLAIVQLMSKNSFERMRGAAARRLADAFRVEKAKK